MILIRRYVVILVLLLHVKLIENKLNNSYYNIQVFLFFRVLSTFSSVIMLGSSF